jgi:hypothetical protein
MVYRMKQKRVHDIRTSVVNSKVNVGIILYAPAKDSLRAGILDVLHVATGVTYG